MKNPEQIKQIIIDAQQANRDIGAINRNTINSYREKAILYIENGQSAVDELNASDSSRNEDVSIWNMQDENSYYIPLFNVKRNSSSNCSMIDPDASVSPESCGISSLEVGISKTTELIKDHINILGFAIRIKPRYRSIFHLDYDQEQYHKFAICNKYEENNWQDTSHPFYRDIE